jgi:hypothetical protein
MNWHLKLTGSGMVAILVSNADRGVSPQFSLERTFASCTLQMEQRISHLVAANQSRRAPGWRHERPGPPYEGRILSMQQDDDRFQPSARSILEMTLWFVCACILTAYITSEKAEPGPSAIVYPIHASLK